jgi:hypothetical protein
MLGCPPIENWEKNVRLMSDGGTGTYDDLLTLPSYQILSL